MKRRTEQTVDNDSPDEHIANEELSAILDEELTRLPAKYHQAIVLLRFGRENAEASGEDTRSRSANGQ